jgi:hypothetical protein
MRARGLSESVNAATTDDFGTLDVQIRRSSLLCVPCTKVLLP